MNRLHQLWQKTLLSHLWRQFQLRCYFKFVLPRRRQVEMDGLKLDLSPLSLKVRNRLLNLGYEAQEKRMCLDFLSPRDTVVELGGAIGFIALVCQKKIGIRHYAVFEANPRTLEVLQRNFTLNGLVPNAWNIALGPGDGTVNLEVGGDFWDHSICPSRALPSTETIQVPSATLETLIKTAGFQPNTLIIDIEGAEALIDFHHLPPSVQKIIIELHPRVIGTQKQCEIIAALIVRGFQVGREEGGTYVFLKHPLPAPHAPPCPGASPGRPARVRAETQNPAPI
jgi:FkbM family methyltransferase